MISDSGVAEDPLKDVRRQLAALARRPKCRTSAFTPERPTEWRPWEVKNPESGMVFTEAGAWEFIADCLESNHPIEQIVLEKPHGKAGYVMIVRSEAGRCPIYIKLELGSGKVIGRSF